MVCTVVTAKCFSGEHCEILSGLDGANDSLKMFHPSEMHRFPVIREIIVKDWGDTKRECRWKIEKKL